MPGVDPTKYRRFPHHGLVDRTWPDRQPDAAPRWCAVDLRDGNQALVEPMGPDDKWRLYRALQDAGFTEIEVGFPAASSTDAEFLRQLIDQRQADETTLQVLTQCRQDLIDATFAALEGAPRSIVHFYNSTSVAQRRDVFDTDVRGVGDLAVAGAEMVLRGRDRWASRMGPVSFEYSPESFTGTEPDAALEVVVRVLETLWAHSDEPVIVNLPATVEMDGPHRFADRVEWVHRNLPNRDRVVVSVHPHNDRGMAVAAAELALAAGADRLEGTLFGNGERTGNLCLVTVALNLYTHGIDPGLYLGDLPALRRAYETATGMAVHPRHPYAGDLVFTAFSGSHQDAIRKGLYARQQRGDRLWDVPYLPIDPADVGRRYEPVIRVNSQSGKGGAAFVVEAELGITLPRTLQIDFAGVVQDQAEASGGELTQAALVSLFCGRYTSDDTAVYGIETARTERTDDPPGGGHETHVTAWVRTRGVAVRVDGVGSGPLEAFCRGLSRHSGQPVEIVEYHEQASAAGSDAQAVALVAVAGVDGQVRWGMGTDQDTLAAAFTAIVNASSLTAAPATPPG